MCAKIFVAVYFALYMCIADLQTVSSWWYMYIVWVNKYWLSLHRNAISADGYEAVSSSFDALWAYNIIQYNGKKILDDANNN